MTTLRRIFIGLALTVAASGIASADSISFICSTAAGSTELGLSGVSGNTSGQVNCSQFNLAGQTLNSITLAITGAVLNGNGSFPTFNSTITLTNTDQASHNFSGSTQAAMNLDGTTPLTGFSFTPDLLNNLLTVNAATGTQSIAGNSSQLFNVSGSRTASATDTTFFTPYMGAGNFSFVIDSSTSLVCNTGGGNGGCDQSTFESATATVTYNYSTPAPPGVPEPATMALMGGALIGLGLVGKRFKKN